MNLPPSPTGEVWLAKITVECLLLVLLIWRGLAGRYVGLTVYLAVAVVKSLTILHAMQTPGGYYPMWVRTHWIQIGAQGVLVLDLLILYAAHFRNIRSFAIALYTAFAVAGMFGSGLVYQIGARWWSAEVQAVASHVKYYGIALCAVLVLARAFYWLYRGRVRVATNVRRIAVAIGLVMAGGTCGHAIQPRLASDACTVGVPLLVWAWCAWSLQKSGEDGVIPPPASPQDRSRWRQEMDERERQLIERFKLAQKLR